MALKAVSVSTSVVLSQKEEIPSQKQMLRTTSQSFKRSSSLLEEAIQVHAKEKEIMQGTIQNLSEENQKLREALEKSEGEHEKKHLIDQTKIRKLEKGIENFSAELKAMGEDMKKICERTIRREDQLGIYAEAKVLMPYSHQPGTPQLSSPWAHLPGKRSVSAHVNFLKSKLDDEWNKSVELPDPFTPFSNATKADMKVIETKLEITLKEYEALEAIAKDAPQEAAAEQN